MARRLTPNLSYEDVIQAHMSRNGVDRDTALEQIAAHNREMDERAARLHAAAVAADA